jgi:hypothetical protein
MDRKPILFTDCLVDVTYMCEWCGTETKRAVREPARPTQQRHPRHGDRRGLVAKAPSREAQGQRPSEYGSSNCPDAKPFG